MPEKKTVLVIDDEEVLRDVVVAKLIESGFNPLAAKDGAQGLEMALEHQPDLIILDIRMPNMSGFQMLKTLRAKGNWGAHVPVIFLSNIEPRDEEELADIEATEPAHYFVKSDIKLEDLAVKIKEVLGIS